MKRKNIYEQPETVVTRVELESPICSGSANFGEESAPVSIDAQTVTDAGNDGSGHTYNDFSSTPWGNEIN